MTQDDQNAGKRESHLAEETLYSIDAVIEALMRTSAACAHAGDGPEVIRGAMIPLIELLQAKCGVFYPTPNSPLGAILPLRIHSAATGEPHIPDQLPPALEEFIFASLQQVATSQDAAFHKEHLQKLPVTTAASSSIWAGVSAGGTRFGILVIFDPFPRSFTGIQQKLARTFSLQMGQGLSAQGSRKTAAAGATAMIQSVSAAPSPAASGSHALPVADNAESVVDRYIDFSRIMSGVSRELINPLTAVLGYIELLKSEPQSEQAMHFLEKLQEQTEKTQTIVSTLSTAPQAYGWKPAAMINPLPASASIHSKPPAEKAVTQKVAEAAPEPHSRILLVQKSEAVMEFQKSVLATVGAASVCTVAGWEAISILQNTKIDGVILDDELDGEWSASKIFTWICDQRPDLAQKVLLTISPKPTEETREWVEGCGIPHVTKPLHIVKLFAGIQRMLGLTTAMQASKFLH